MNNITLMGRLTADPEINYSGKGKDELCIATMRVACQSNYNSEKTNFITVKAFGQKAEFAEKYLHRGKRYTFAGELETGSYDDKEGITRTYALVVANLIEFADSPRDDEDDESSRSSRSSRSSNRRIRKEDKAL